MLPMTENVTGYNFPKQNFLFHFVNIIPNPRIFRMIPKMVQCITEFSILVFRTYYVTFKPNSLTQLNIISNSS